MAIDQTGGGPGVGALLSRPRTEMLGESEAGPEELREREELTEGATRPMEGSEEGKGAWARCGREQGLDRVRLQERQCALCRAVGSRREF